MTQDMGKDVFTFTWRIENFSMCPHKEGQMITSPTFVVDILEEKMFLLSLYPKGFENNDADSVACMLSYIKRKEDPEEIRMNFRLSFLEADMNLLNVWSKNNQVITKTRCLSFANLFPITTLFENKSVFLPNDVLTLQFCIMLASDQKESPAEPKESMNFHDTPFSLEEVSSVVSDDSMPTQHCRTRCSFHTRIPVERRQVTWTIKNFDSILKTKKRIPVSVESKLRWKSALLLSCYVSEDGNSGGSVRIDIQRKDKDFTQIFVRCKVSVLDGNSIAQESQEGEHLFGEDYETWSFPPIIKLRTLENRKPVLLVDDKLSLRFEFFVSYKGEEDTPIGPDRKTENSISNDNLRSGLTKMQNDQTFTDVTLFSQGVEFLVHRIVLCAQSPVFRAKFSGDASENKTGIVIITDIDADTVANMISFMYKNWLQELRPEDASKLYSAAHKYKILRLKNRCAAILKYNLSLSSVCDVLVLADRHQDTDLIRSVINFLQFHEKDVFQSKQWNELVKDNTLLTERIKNKILTSH